jgi:riboflavin kinase/FMN adenylyltransferase
MLEIVEYGKDEYTFPSLLVLGCFDSIHLGHRELFKKAKLEAKINGLDLGVMMFRDGKGGKLVYSFEERVKMLEDFNVKFVLVIDYTPEFMSIAPLDFLATVEDKINVKGYMSGKDFKFGAGAKGKSSTLKSYAEDEENGVWYQSIKDVMDGDEKISTTLIKSCLDKGDVVRAGQLLGSNFFVEGEVVSGAGRGKEIGFPTVNIVYPENKYPIKQGVYMVKSTIDGVEYFGIANYGNCPTFNDDRVILEVNLQGYNGDLYGKILKIEFVGYIRDIEKFDNPEELKKQLTKDLSSIKS